jgi:probable F420-dependent oxidoreductase
MPVRHHATVRAGATYHRPMRYGLCLPNYTGLASAEAIERAADAADRLGFADVWTTDHVLVDTSADAADYRTNFDVLEVLAWVGAKHPGLGLGTSVIVVPQRNGIVVGKQLATLDALSAGRVIAGVGVGWSETEFANLGMAERFSVRGAYLEETIQLWRHLWSGSSEPFHGRFHDLTDFVFGPLPAHRSALPIWIGGRNDAALARAGRLADGYHATSSSPAAFAARIPILRAAADAAGRPLPTLSTRVRLALDEPTESAEARSYALRGSDQDARDELARWEDVGLEHMAIWPGGDSLEAYLRSAERFSRLAIG